MTFTSTQERPARLEEAEWVEPEPAAAASLGRVDGPPAAAVATRGSWTWVEVEEPDPPRRETDWLTRFAWAKTSGGW